MGRAEEKILKTGDAVPADVHILDENGAEATLAQFAGQYLVVYFYPKDNTPGCTIEACSLRDTNSEIEKLGAKVIGVSRDNSKSHAKFKIGHKLNFDLWSDVEGKLADAFGVWIEKSMFGRKYMSMARATFLIGPDQKILHVWPKVNPLGHGEDVLDKLKSVQKS